MKTTKKPPKITLEYIIENRHILWEVILYPRKNKALFIAFTKWCKRTILRCHIDEYNTHRPPSLYIKYPKLNQSKYNLDSQLLANIFYAYIRIKQKQRWFLKDPRNSYRLFKQREYLEENFTNPFSYQRKQKPIQKDFLDKKIMKNTA